MQSAVTIEGQTEDHEDEGLELVPEEEEVLHDADDEKVYKSWSDYGD